MVATVFDNNAKEPMKSSKAPFTSISAPKYTVDLASFQSLNNVTQSRTVSLAFNLTVHVDNSASFQACCLNHGEVVVSYSGVALAWGRVPGRFCVPRRSVTSFTVMTWGKGVHLSDDLRRRRLSPDWRAGTVKVLVDMKLHRYPNYALPPITARPSTSSISQELVLGNTSALQISLS
ncbi:hypothetical protein PR202_ga09903 [Eleusine coracana subsp. coracana]|uniref:Uncharacterized protein n=1 Tax=Eleusine coracana subsp. coracana TaxID=191504 RepID=A0AAV5C5D5_ELECO|nr:hypothetical protein PR202_ga09903 [Eleusine coracana subsp. coracana]